VGPCSSRPLTRVSSDRHDLIVASYLDQWLSHCRCRPLDLQNGLRASMFVGTLTRAWILTGHPAPSGMFVIERELPVHGTDLWGDPAALARFDAEIDKLQARLAAAERDSPQPAQG
jgi:hypothetical protein